METRDPRETKDLEVANETQESGAYSSSGTGTSNYKKDNTMLYVMVAIVVVSIGIIIGINL